MRVCSSNLAARANCGLVSLAGASYPRVFSSVFFACADFLGFLGEQAIKAFASLPVAFFALMPGHALGSSRGAQALCLPVWLAITRRSRGRTTASLACRYPLGLVPPSCAPYLPRWAAS